MVTDNGERKLKVYLVYAIEVVEHDKKLFGPQVPTHVETT
jgi:hypothetical protein